MSFLYACSRYTCDPRRRFYHIHVQSYVDNPQIGARLISPFQHPNESCSPH